MGLSWENHSWAHSWTPFVMKADGVRVSVEPSMLPQLLLPPRLLVFDSTEEQQSFDFFRSRSVRELTELVHVDETFWNLSVLQMSMTQPAVRYAVIALGALHRKYASGCTTAVPEDTSDAQTRFALEQSNRSIKSLLAGVGSEARSEKVSTLVACILHTCLASIQGYQTQSIMHFRNGLRLLDSLDHPKDMVRSSMTCYDTQFQSFVTTLSSLEIQARSLLCEENLPPWPTRTRIRGCFPSQGDIRFTSLSDARNFFESILNDFQCFAIDRDADSEWLLSPGATPRPSAMEEYHLLGKRHSSGVEELESFIAKHNGLNDRDKKMILMLRLHICLVEMYMAVYPLSIEHGDRAWDHLGAYYLRINSMSRQILGCTEDDLSTRLCSPTEVKRLGIHNIRNHNDDRIPAVASILKKGDRQPHRSVFAFSQGVVGPLSTVAVQCRSPSVRREAIAMLLLYPRREGLWDSHTAGRVAWEVMCLEEELARQSRGECDRAEYQIKAASDIPVDCRVSAVDMVYIGPRVSSIRFNTVKECEKGEQGRIPMKILEW